MASLQKAKNYLPSYIKQVSMEKIGNDSGQFVGVLMIGGGYTKKKLELQKVHYYALFLFKLGFRGGV
jgi:hypothetical protein